MTKEILDKYSKISIIVIAIILVISFVGIIYSKIWAPYQEQLEQEKEDQKYLEASKKNKENQVLLSKCYANIEVVFRQRAFDNCVYKTGNGHMTCFVSSEEYPQFDRVDNACGEYFYCNSDFWELNTEAEKTERRNGCKKKYPLF